MTGSDERSGASAVFEQLDFLYTPSSDVPGDLRFFEEIIGGRVVFTISDMDTKVAAVELTSGPPLVLLTDHLESERPILVYRVADLDATLVQLARDGLEPERSLEIPHGPCSSLRTPGGHRIALYQLTRPEVAAHFEGRRDF
ncbi:MAG: VOC family protein [Actinomycetota bacterium]|nr:VOC family protein [Actinomycetota bacterium]